MVRAKQATKATTDKPATSKASKAKASEPKQGKAKPVAVEAASKRKAKVRADLSKVPFGERLAKRFDLGEIKAGQYGSPNNTGVEREHDLPWGATKIAVFRTLKALGARTRETAVSGKHVIAKANGEVSARDVRHYCYHAKADGLSQVHPSPADGSHGYGFSITAKGIAELAKHAK